MRRVIKMTPFIWYGATRPPPKFPDGLWLMPRHP
jgi:hypothetical protein